jgi:hypothetical protein
MIDTDAQLVLLYLRILPISYITKENRMNISEATPEQIAAFEKGAVARYKEQGVPDKLAEGLLAAELEKIAADLGVASQSPTVRVEKVASELASALGRTRNNQ